MNIKLKVLSEDVRVDGGVEYVTATGMEDGAEPLLQMCDYTLQAGDLHLKGKLPGKVLHIKIHSIRNIFAGRAQLVGKITEVK